MFGIGTGELIFLMLLSLLLFGPHKLPEIMRSIGKMIASIRKAANEFERNLNAESWESTDKEKPEE